MLRTARDGEVFTPGADRKNQQAVSHGGVPFWRGRGAGRTPLGGDRQQQHGRRGFALASGGVPVKYPGLPVTAWKGGHGSRR
ncbi:hypothetical protein KCP69_21995 [Salmonella enterica subsp. enterica]|nr:hypothetical protein KCP69_21995 [Salmonella enterica subsp. enterica]